jgi:hypothetical protein
VRCRLVVGSSAETTAATVRDAAATPDAAPCSQPEALPEELEEGMGLRETEGTESAVDGASSHVPRAFRPEELVCCELLVAEEEGMPVSRSRLAAALARAKKVLVKPFARLFGRASRNSG